MGRFWTHTGLYAAIGVVAPAAGVAAVMVQHTGFWVAVATAVLLVVVPSSAALWLSSRDRRQRCDRGQAELASSKTAARLATELNTKFVRALAHDLREPVRGIANFAELLAERDLPQNQRAQFLERIREASRRAHDQIVELRSFALLRNGADDDEVSQQPLSQTMAEVLEALTGRVEAAGARVHLSFEDDAGQISFPTAIRHVISNFVENAIKYGGTRPNVQIAVATRQGELELSVTDDGPGLSDDEKAAVFEPYERGGHADSGSGLGLGLSICRELVAQMGGRIWAEAGSEGGARFVVRLPIT